ncbi:M48 family peptidase [compost metagenome]
MAALNPDAYPSGTNQRFSVFILTAGAQAWILGDWYANFLPSPFSLINDVYVSVFVSAYVYVLAYLLYLLHPRAIIKKEGLKEIEGNSTSSVQDTVNKLAEIMGCQAPKIFVSENYRRQAAKVFGVGRQKILKMDGGFTLMRARDPETFKAIILHELAHIKNGDIFKGYYSRCLFWVALIATMPIILYRGISYIVLFIDVYPEMLVHLNAGNYKWFILWHFQNIPRFFSSIAPFLFMQLILTIEYCSILRAREHHADWTASVHGVRDTLISIFENSRKPSKKSGFYFFRKHPSFAKRAAFILHPEKTSFEVSGLDAFLTSYAVYTTFQISMLVAELFFAAVGGQRPIGADWSDKLSSLLVVTPILSAGIIYAAIIWSKMVQKFSAGEWLRKSDWGTIIKHFIHISFFSALGVLAGELFWPEQHYSAMTEAELLESFKNTLFFLPAMLISAYFVFISTMFGISRSEGKQSPTSLFIIGHIIAILGFNIGVSFSLSFTSDQEIADTLESLGIPLLPLIISGIVQNLIYIAVMFGLLRLFLRRRSKVSPEAFAPAWLLVPE